LSPELTTALREETPIAPVELRERVAHIAATPPSPPRTLSLRRVLLYAAPVTAAVSLAVALAVGIETAAFSDESSSSPPAGAVTNLDRFQSESGERSPAPARRQAAPMPAPTAHPHQPRAQIPDPTAPATRRAARLPAPTALARQRAAPAPAPTAKRAQNFQAEFRILLDDTNDLSTATQQALRTTRRLGGYVVTVQYGTPEPSEGTANLRVRIPVSRVQAAIVQLSSLGQILAQQTQVTDLQHRLDELTRQIRRAKGDKARIAALRRERTELNRRAAFATLAVDLTTHEPEEEAASPGRLERAVDDATDILAAELAIGAYALIVASPFLLLLAAAFAGNRAYRRYADQRLLERA
jgi:hypothetical protein